MGNMNERLDTLANRLAIKIGYAEFSYHIMYMVSSGNYPGTLFEHWNDFADYRTILHGIGCGHGNNRNPTFRARGAIDKIQLTANPAEELRANAVSAHLASQIDFDG